MKIINFGGGLTDISAVKEVLILDCAIDGSSRAFTSTVDTHFSARVDSGGYLVTLTRIHPAFKWDSFVACRQFIFVH